MCCRRLLLLALVGIYLTTASAIYCYIGVENQCVQGPDMTDCGSGNPCVCVKYRFECTASNPGCSPEEQALKVKKWVYTMVSDKTCKLMESRPSYFEGISCCSTNGCNTPISGTCSPPPVRRRSLRELTNLFQSKS